MNRTKIVNKALFITLAIAFVFSQIAYPLPTDPTVENGTATVEVKDNVMSYEINSAYLSFEYRIVAGDDRSDWETVTVIAAPRIQKAEVTLTYPEYTQKPSETVDALTLTAPEGTGIKWVLFLDRAVSESSMVTATGTEKKLSISDDGLRVEMEEVVMNLDKPREFYDPHFDFSGAALHIPSEVQRIANELSGNTLPLREAIARIQAVTGGLVEIEEKSKSLWLTFKWTSELDSQCYHFHFRIISFR